MMITPAWIQHQVSRVGQFERDQIDRDIVRIQELFRQWGEIEVDPRPLGRSSFPGRYYSIEGLEYMVGFTDSTMLFRPDGTYNPLEFLHITDAPSFARAIAKLAPKAR